MASYGLLGEGSVFSPSPIKHLGPLWSSPRLGRSFCAITYQHELPHGRLTPSTPVSSSTLPARPPHPSWRMRLMISRSCMPVKMRLDKQSVLSTAVASDAHEPERESGERLVHRLRASRQRVIPIAAPVAFGRLTSCHRLSPGGRSPGTAPRPHRHAADLPPASCRARRGMAARLPCNDDPRAGDSRRLCRPVLLLCHRLFDGRRCWSWFPCGDDPHRIGRRLLPLPRTLGTVGQP